MPQRIIYRSENDTQPFEKERFIKSLKKYDDNVSQEMIDKILEEEFGAYEPLHVTCLIEIGARVISDEEKAKEYFDSHKEWFDATVDFERLRRITGYLVGTLSRWNDAKKAEEKARVKHGLNGQYTQNEKAEIEAAKLENSVMSQF